MEFSSIPLQYTSNTYRFSFLWIQIRSNGRCDCDCEDGVLHSTRRPLMPIFIISVEQLMTELTKQLSH